MKAKETGLFLADKEYYVAANSMEDAVRVFKAQTDNMIGSIEAVGTVIVEDKSQAVISGKEILRHRRVLTNHGERLIAGL